MPIEKINPDGTEKILGVANIWVCFVKALSSDTPLSTFFYVAYPKLELEKFEVGSIFTLFPINTICRERAQGIKLLRTWDFQTLKMH